MVRTRPHVIYYWDSSVFIEWFQGKNPEKVKLIREVVVDVNDKRAIIATSSITPGETLSGNLKKGSAEEMAKVYKLPSLQIITLTAGISILAADIRRKHKKLKLPDAQHLATAIACHANELHTFDDSDLIPLSGTILGHPLIIKYPGGTLPQLF